MLDARQYWLRQVLHLQRVSVLAGLALLAFACGEKFRAGDAVGGAGGQAGRDTVIAAGSGVGGDGVPDGGGGDTVAGAPDGGAPDGGAPDGGRGGISSVGGSGGKANNGGGSLLGGSGGSGGTVVVVPPVPLEGLELWFDANEGATETNGAVSSWKDNSGHKRDALQTALNYRPKLAASGLKGKPALVFEGDDYLKLPALPGDFSQGVSIFTVTQPDSDKCAGIFEASNGPEIDDVHLGVWENALLFEVSSSYLSASKYPLTFGVPQLLAAVQQKSSSAQARRNSEGLGELSFALPATVERQSVFIGRTDYSGCGPYVGMVSELLVYSRAVSDEELIGIESYLQKKWACCSE
jgi:hypothetical protein